MLAEYRCNRPAASIRATVRVQPCTRTVPISGNLTLFGPATRTGALCPGDDLERSRNAGVLVCRDLNRGYPTRSPARVPVREVVKLARACAASTLAHSNTSALTSP